MAEDIGFEPDFNCDFDKPKKSKKKAERSAPDSEPKKKIETAKANVPKKTEAKSLPEQTSSAEAAENAPPVFRGPKELTKSEIRRRKINAALERNGIVTSGEAGENANGFGEAGGLSRSAQKKLKRRLWLEKKEREEKGEVTESAEPELKKLKIADEQPKQEQQKKEEVTPKDTPNKKKGTLRFEDIEIKFSDLLAQLVENTHRFKEGEELIKKDVEAGKITKEEADVLYRVYNRNLRVKKHRERLIQLVGEQAPLNVVKERIEMWVRAGKITRADAGVVFTRWKKKEIRRFERRDEKNTNSFCFHCRESGHKVAGCPKKEAAESEAGVCFKCGSGEHSIHQCKKKVKGFPFASCFVCKEVGHISRDCHQNQNGVYPDGGSCNVCGSTSHLKRNCPELAAQKVGANPDRKQYSARAFNNSMADSGDADYDPTEAKVEMKPVKKQAKHIKF